MKTLTEKYNAVLKGKFSKSQFVKDAKRELPRLVSPYNGYEDTVSILKSKAMIFEAVKDTYESSAELEYSKIDGIDKFPMHDIERGIDYELEAAGFDSVSLEGVTLEEKEKACKKVVKNLEKDPLHYINLISGESSKVDKHDKMVPVKKGNEVDVHNGMKKATLKENFDPTNLKPGDDDPDNPFGVIRKIIKGKNGYEIMGKEGSEEYYYFVDFNGNELDEDDFIYEDKKVEEGVAKKLDMIRQHLHKRFTDPNNPKNKVIDDEMIDGFFSVAPDNLLDLDIEEVEHEYDMYVDANYDRVDEKIAKSVDDVIDPHDYVEIGQGYLKGFKRPHSLKDADLETLGRKIVKVLARGDIEKAKRKFVDEVMGVDRKGNKKPEDSPSNYTKANEQMTDAEMDAIKDYGKEDTPVKPYVLGDKFSTDFDYEGMLKAGLNVRLNTPIDNLQKLYDSFEDVNYHSENRLLADVIDKLEKKDKTGALEAIKNYKKEIRKTLESINEGKTPIREEVNEYRGSADDIDRIVKDKAMDSGFEEREEAAEVIEYLANKYNLNLKMIQSYMDSPDEPVNPFAEDDVEETKGAPKGHYFTKSGNLVKGRLTKDARERGARLSDPKDKQRSKVPPVTQYKNEGEGDDHHYIKVPRKDFKKAEAIIAQNIDGNFVKMDYVDNDGAGNVIFYFMFKDGDIASGAAESFMYDTVMDLGSSSGIPVIDHSPEIDHRYTYIGERNNEIDEKKGKDHDGDGDIDSDDYMAAKDKAIKKAMGKDKLAKESIKAIITKVLEEGVITEAATQNLASFAETYGGFEGMKAAIIQLQDIVTDIESYYDKTRINIQKVYNTLGDIRNEEGLKVGGFLAPAIETAFNKDLRPVTKLGFTKGLDTPKVKVLSRDDMMRMKSGQDIEEKQTVYSPVRENKNKNKKK